MKSSRSTRIALILIVMLLPACESEVQSPDLGFLYNELAKEESPERNPVILIPGILGSRLIREEDGSVVWGAWGSGPTQPSDDEALRLLALPMTLDQPLAELRDEVQAAGALDRVKISLLGLSVELKAYLGILRTLGVGGYRDEELGEAKAVDYGTRHYTCFQFAYDWRRDLVESARALHAFVLDKRAYVVREHERRFGVREAPVRFDVVAHSMGGLVLRYYLRYGTQDLPADGSLPQETWAGAEFIDNVILIATPNAGSIDSFEHLVDGVELLPSLPEYPAAVLGTMPSVYQLLPRTRHRVLVNAAAPQEALNIMDPALWERMQWGLLDPRQDDVLKQLLPEVEDRDERLAIARDHVSKSLARAEHFHRAMDASSNAPADLALYLVAGDAVRTDSVAAVEIDSGHIKIHASGPGDGSVLRSSALLDERAGKAHSGRLITPIQWRGVQFLFTDHLGLTEDPAFADNVLYLLLEQPRLRHTAR